MMMMGNMSGGGGMSGGMSGGGMMDMMNMGGNMGGNMNISGNMNMGGGMGNMNPNMMMDPGAMQNHYAMYGNVPNGGTNSLFQGVLNLTIDLLGILLVIGLIIGLVVLIKRYVFEGQSLNLNFAGATTTCTKCGQALKADWNCCPKCGESKIVVTETAQATVPAQPAAKTDNNQNKTK